MWKNRQRQEREERRKKLFVYICGFYVCLDVRKMFLPRTHDTHDTHTGKIVSKILHLFLTIIHCISIAVVGVLVCIYNKYLYTNVCVRCVIAHYNRGKFVFIFTTYLMDVEQCEILAKIISCMNTG